MTFWDHIDELRKALIEPLIAFLILTLVAFLFKEEVFQILLAPNSTEFITFSIIDGSRNNDSQRFILELINTELSAQLLIHMKISFYIGIVFSFPILLYKLFKFISPGLYENEKHYSRQILVSSFLAFIVGVIFNYFVIFPVSLRFMANYQVSDQILNMINITSYLDSLMSLSVIMGICFELPVILLLLSRLGLVTSNYLKKHRRQSLLLIVLIAAVITPTTDIVTLILVSFPIIVLYEVSFWVVKITEGHIKEETKSIPINE